MSFSIYLIHGLALGIEHVSKDDELGIDETCVIVDLFIFRCVIGMGDYDEL